MERRLATLTSRSNFSRPDVQEIKLPCAYGEFRENITVERRYASGRLDRLSELAAELVHLPVDVIVVEGPAPVRAAAKATKTIPIVIPPKAIAASASSTRTIGTTRSMSRRA